MISTLKDYAEKNGYVLAAVFGETSCLCPDPYAEADDFDVHYYYVRDDFPESSEIISKLATFDYFYFTSGKKSSNYALLKP